MSDSTPSAPCLVALLALVLATGSCLAPRAEGDAGSFDEFRRMLDDTGGQPVTGTGEELEADPGPDPALQESPEEIDVAAAAELLAAAQSTPPAPVEESPYLQFGERILVRERDGFTFVTKPYTLPPGRPDKVTQLMGALKPFPFRQMPEVKGTDAIPAQDPTILEYRILSGFDDEYYTNFGSFESQGPVSQAKPLNDVMVVTATPALLARFEDFLDLFAGGGVPQIELEAKIIEIVESDTLDVGSSGSLLFGSGNFVNSFDFTLPNLATSTDALLTLGTLQDQVNFSAILEAIKNWQNVSIETRPKTVVRSGGVAMVDASRDIPFIEFKTLDAKGFFTTSTTYKKIGTQLWISPRRVGSKTLALDVKLVGSQNVGTQAVLQAQGSATPIEIPIIAYRTAKTVVHLQPGQTLVIGGMTQEKEQEITSKVPVLGEIPILGWLFRSTLRVKERQHVIFAISPRIIQRSDFDSEL